MGRYNESMPFISVPEAIEEIRAALAKIISALVRGIRRGCFPVFNREQRCTSYCPFSTICRIRQIRSLEKTWLPTP